MPTTTDVGNVTLGGVQKGCWVSVENRCPVLCLSCNLLLLMNINKCPPLG